MSRPIVFTCPATNFRVQHYGDDTPEGEHDGVDCPACSRLHFINRTTGKVLGHENQ